MSQASSPSLDAGQAAVLHCFHCAQPVPDGTNLHALVRGERQPMCCAGCQAVTELIVGGGLGSYYRYRTKPARPVSTPGADDERQARAYDVCGEQEGIVHETGAAARQASLLLHGIECGACAWLNERHLRALAGVEEARVNYVTHRAHVVWNPALTSLGEILIAVKRLGYAASPYNPARHEAMLERERGRRLRRLGVAGLLGMQVMMISAALYAGAWTSIDPAMRDLLRWAALALCLPVVGYAAQPFFSSAWRSLAKGRTNVDMPVALGIGAAFAASAQATITGTGEVYFDSVVMFVFFLGLARYLQFIARRASAYQRESMTAPLPALATRINASDGARESVVVAALAVGDRIAVRPGEPIPVDARVLEGRSSVDQALLTGESQPLSRCPGETVLGGSINLDSALELEVLEIASRSFRAAIDDLVERAASFKPAISRLADRVAGTFVSGVLVLSAVVAVYWWRVDPQHWLPITLSVLVVSCPCALSLATPTAITAAVSVLGAKRLIVTDPRAIETLGRASHVVFDKTGTLTRGRYRVHDSVVPGDLSREACLRIAASLEAHSEHPIGEALREAAQPLAPARVRDPCNSPGAGLKGTIDNRTYWLGRPAYVARETGRQWAARGSLRGAWAHSTHVVLADDSQVLCVFALSDEIRPGAAALVRHLASAGLGVSICSGDRQGAVTPIAEALGIAEAVGDLSPRDKHDAIRSRQARGEIVVMVGDGLNDAPVLSVADVSVAMGTGALATQAKAGMIALSDDLGAVHAAVDTARGTMRVIRQNLAWAVLYNAVALPAAATGLLAPWIAAAGMSASALIVVGNSLRLRRAYEPDI